MKDIIRNKTVGFYLSCAVAVLTGIAMVVYMGSINFSATAEAVLAAALAVEIIYLFTAGKVKNDYWNLIPVVASVLLAAGICVMMYYQVEQIGWCVAGLDGWDILTSFFVSLALVVVGLIVSVAGCFAEN